MASKVIKLAVYQRSTETVKTRLTNILQKVTALAAVPEPLTQVQVRKLAGYLSEATRRRDEFETNFRRVYEVPAEDLTDVDLQAEHEIISELVGDIVSQIEALLPEPVPAAPGTPGTPPAAAVVAPLPVHSQVALPHLSLKTFSGNPAEWVTFFSLFNSAVHNSTTMSATLKMQYLVGSLQGDALAMVSSLDISAANYLTAYDLLRTRFHNLRRLKMLHLKALLWELPEIHASSPHKWRTFVNIYNEHSQALAALNCPLTGDNPFLSAYLLVRLDPDMSEKLEAYRSIHDAEPHSLPTADEILEFLTYQSDLVEDARTNSKPTRARSPARRGLPPPPRRDPWNSYSRGSKGVALLSQEASGPSSSAKCVFCHSNEHRIYTCPKFTKLSTKDRSKEIKNLRRCYSCLGAHHISQCKSDNTCKKCQKSHHTLLHWESPSRPEPGRKSPAPKVSPTDTAASHHVTMTSQGPHVAHTTVLLCTTLVHLRRPDGFSQVLRGLLDSGSTTSFLSEHAAQLIRSPRYHSNLQVAGISSSNSHTRGLTRLDVCTLSGDLISASHTLHILPKISVPLPRAVISPEVVLKAKDYVLADPSFHMPGPVDVLLGADLFPLVLTQEAHSLGPNMPTVLGTRFGHVVTGVSSCLAPPDSTPTSHHSVALLSTGDMDLHTSLQRFWTMEEPPQCTQKSAEEVQCDEHFLKTHTRTADGRYCVSLPFKTSPPALGISQPQAEKRFRSLERKFKTQPQFARLYKAFMSDYENRGHMAKATDLDLSSPHYFLPHHGILKGSGDTQKIRTVFDASAKTSSGVSLNELMLVSPKLQADICDLLLKFRSYQVVFTCDVEQMYRQILVDSEHQQYQLILWRPSSSHPLDIYKLLTVTYGTSCAPYLAIKTLHQLADDEGAQFPAAAKVLRHQTYVDDVLAGSDSLPEALQLQQELINLLQRGGFVLKKWSSNRPELLSTLPPEHLGAPTFLESGSPAHLSVLGLCWSPSSDHFKYKLNLPCEARTKRQILSLIAQIYDPCGFLAPVTIKCKIFMQALWSQGFDWDAPLPDDYQEKWQVIQAELPLLAEVIISRPLSTVSATTVELHGFSDASDSGYAAAIYIRCVYPNDSIAVRLILAKTRVAPLKKVTIPRLELCGAHLLAQLARYVLSTLSHIEFSSHQLWCDSSVVLAWLRTSPHRLKTFVANRVAQIQDWVPPQVFQHVEGICNPADCASRGILASQLLDHPLWWSGPPWLSQPTACWSRQEPSLAPSQELPDSAQEEFKSSPVTALLAVPQDSWDLLTKFSSWDRLQRVLAFVLRFKDNTRRLQDRRSGLLSASELLSARLAVIRLVQRASFPEDISALQRQVQPSPRLRRLSPFLDQDGLLRVGGRLTHSSLPHTSKHPLLLPQDHPIVDLIIDAHHVHHLHAGPQLTQAALSRAYWILSARSKIRSRIFKCITCFKQRPRFAPPKMADLPMARVNPSKPFSHTGIDYAGPFLIKMLHLRGSKQVKVYLCLFVCLATKALHLEVVTDLTTDAFVAALSRFTSRRGRCSHIYSDCGTNFIGAASELSAIVKALKSPESRQLILHATAPHEINFHFNPPSAPHFGGLWESAVKSAKHHLRRVMGDQLLTLPEFITLVTQVEAMLNSRPLTPLSADPRECAALTPGHFLTGEPLTAVPEPPLQESHVDLRRRFSLVKALHQRLWHRWQEEYLHTLQQRPKWTSPQRDLQIGDLVLMSTPSPPLSWPLGRVSALHPGDDGVVRVVDVTTPRGVYRRPVIKLARLPVDA